FATLVVAWVAHRAVPDLPWASAFVLGAVVSPPDVAAATAFLRRLPMPRRVVTVREGESMVNDAAAIVADRMAIAAAVSGTFSRLGSFCSVLGLPLRPILGSLGGAVARELARAALLVSLAVIVARLVWIFPAGSFRWLFGRRLRPREPRPRWQILTVVGWAGL